MKALLVDDHAMFRDGLSLLIAHRFADVELLHAGNLAQALTQLARHADLDVVLLDLALPDSSGLEALTRLRETDTWARIVVLSADDTPTTVQGAIEQGAAGFIPKTAEGAVLVACQHHYAALPHDTVMTVSVHAPGAPPRTATYTILHRYL